MIVSNSLFPTEQQLQALFASDLTGPVNMANLTQSMQALAPPKQGIAPRVTTV